MHNEIYYKVVSLIGGKFYSSIARSGEKIDKRLKLRYRYNEFTYPEIQDSKLFVFSNYIDAEIFSSSSQRIYECEVINPVRMMPIGYDDAENVCDFWKLRKEGRSTRKYRKLDFDNCYACDAVKLTRLVKKEYNYD